VRPTVRIVAPGVKPTPQAVADLNVPSSEGKMDVRADR
jgi:hypothetical protein